MSLLLNKDFNGLELGRQRRALYHFSNISDRVVLRFSSTCCYKLLNRSINLYKGGMEYHVVANPTEIVTEGTIPVTIRRNNTKIKSTPIRSEITAGWVINYDSNINGPQVVDATVQNMGASSNSPLPPADLQVGGRQFTEEDVFFLVIKKWGEANQNPSGFLELFWEEM